SGYGFHSRDDKPHDNRGHSRDHYKYYGSHGNKVDLYAALSSNDLPLLDWQIVRCHYQQVRPRHHRSDHPPLRLEGHRSYPMSPLQLLRPQYRHPSQPDDHPLRSYLEPDGFQSLANSGQDVHYHR